MPQATSFDSLLAQCRDLVCDSMVQALGDMLDKSDDALGALASQTRDPKSQKLYTVTRNKVSAQRETILTQFRLRYLREFQERGNKVKKIGESFAEIDLSSLELELMADDDLNETLRLNAMVDRLREYCDEELVALDQRAGVLLGDANLQAEDNPFTPQAICEAYNRTCHQIDSNVDVRMVLLKLFDDYVLDQIRGIYKAVNGVLVENSILPTIRIVARRGKKGEPPPAAPAPAAPVADKTPAGEQDLFALLQNLVASNLKAAPVAGADVLAPGAGGSAVGAGGSGGTVVLQGADLLQSLTRIQVGDVSAVTGGTLSTPGHGGEPETTNVLRELKGTSVGAGMNRMDVMTLDIVALLFDQLFDDPRIPIGVKGLIGRLQIPMLKIAIADKTFFSKKTHPARLMLDTLGELAARLPADVNALNPVFASMATILQELQDEFEDDVEIFVTMRERLQALIAEADELIEQETRLTVEQVQQNESLALAKTVAQAEIKIRVRGRDVPRSVIEFLIQQWIKLLMIVQVKDGEQSEAWRNALDTMDLLIASVEPKGTPEERRKLVTMVPDVLKRLTEGLKAAGVEDSVRLGFFAELRKVHSERIAGPEKSRFEATQSASEEDGDATIPGLQPIAAAPAEDLTTVVPSEDLTPVDLLHEEVPAVKAPSVRPAADEAFEFTPADLATFAQPTPATPSEIPAPLDLTAADAPIAELTPANAANPDLIAFELTPADAPVAELTPSPEQAIPAGPAPDADAPLDAISFDLTPAELPEAAPLTAAGLHESAPAEVTAADEMPAGVPPLDLMSFELTPVEAAPADPAPAEVSPLDLISFDLPTLDPTPPATKAPEQPAVPDLPSFDLPTLDLTAVAEPARPAPAVAPPPPPAPPAASAGAPVPPARTPPPAPAQTRPPAPAQSRAPAPAQSSPPAPAQSRAPAPTQTTPPAPPPRPAPMPPASTPAAAAPAQTPPLKAPAAPAPARAPAPPVRPPAAAPAVKAPAAKTPAAPSPAALDFTAAVTVNNPFGQGEVQVDDLDFTSPSQSAGKGVTQGAPQLDVPANLKLGTWVKIREPGAKDAGVVAKLSFVSPLKTRYLFVDRQGKTVLQCSPVVLAKRYRDGEIVIEEPGAESPLFDRIMGGVVGKLRTAEATPPARPPASRVAK